MRDQYALHRNQRVLHISAEQLKEIVLEYLGCGHMSQKASDSATVVGLQPVVIFFHESVVPNDA